MNTTVKYTQIKTTTKLKVDFDQVVYMAADINYTTLFFKNGKTEVYAYTLKAFENNNGINSHFKRIHKGYMVNDNYVEAWQKRQVLLLGGGKLPISRRRQVK
jgi:DNA-binding LytR/AlgR family response regulator